MKNCKKQSGTETFRLLILLLMILFCTAGCENKTPIKVGFAGCLTGRLSDLGISGRNGVMLAVEQINKAGGIRGHRVELIIKDDKHDAETARRVDKELIQEGVVAIIGHMTSTMTMAVIPLINKEKIVMISPTASTNELTGIDDYFFRVTPSTIAEVEILAGYIFQTMGLKKMACVYDLSNRTFTEAWYQNFKKDFEKRGGKIIFTESFTSGKDMAYLDMTRNLLRSNPEGLIIIAGALDTAMICQQLRKLGSNLPVISSGWGNTPDLIQHGGTAVEGVIVSQTYDYESLYEPYQKFKKAFAGRFGKDPDFGSIFGYEAARLLIQALSQDDAQENLKAALLRQKRLNGLQGEIRMDKYGDATCKRFLITVKDGQFRTME